MSWIQTAGLPYVQSEVENAERRTADQIQDDENVLDEWKEKNPDGHISKRRSSMLESILSEMTVVLSMRSSRFCSNRVRHR